MITYFANPAGDAAEQAMQSGELGFIDTPDQGNALPDNVFWCADNGCFSKKRAVEGIPWDELGWFRFLKKNAHAADRCAFATAPDVLNWFPFVNAKGEDDFYPVGDAVATVERFHEYEPKIRRLGYKVALVAQDGLTVDMVPWDKVDAIFIGGSDDFKVGTAPPGRVRPLKLDGTPLGTPGCLEIVAEAKRRGKWVHMGRVNSNCRLRFAHDIGCDSADGTYLTKAPDINLPNLMGWLDNIKEAA